MQSGGLKNSFEEAPASHQAAKILSCVCNCFVSPENLYLEAIKRTHNSTFGSISLTSGSWANSDPHTGFHQVYLSQHALGSALMLHRTREHACLQTYYSYQGLVGWDILTVKAVIGNQDVAAFH